MAWWGEKATEGPSYLKSEEELVQKKLNAKLIGVSRALGGKTVRMEKRSESEKEKGWMPASS